MCFRQRIDITCFFLLFGFVACLLPMQVQAQSSLTGKELFEKLQKGDLTIDQASTLLSQKTGISLTDLDAKEILENLQIKKIAPDIAGNLLDSVSKIEIPPDIAKALSKLDELGQLKDLKDITKVFENPEIIDGLNKILSLGGLTTDIQTKLQETINKITQLVSIPQDLINIGIDKVADAIVDTLKSVAPGLVNALGGETVLSNIIAFLLGVDLTSSLPTAGTSCESNCSTCKDCPEKITNNHDRIRSHVSTEFQQHRNWFINNFFLENIAPALGFMTSQLTTTGMQKIQIIGTFFDAKHQMETQRLFQTMTAQAHKDYQPSEGLCEIGTNIRSLAASERRSDLAHTIIANRMMSRQLLNSDTLSAEGSRSDRESRLDLFRKKFCNSTDHANGLQSLCKNTNTNRSQINMDVDYTNAMDNKLTLDMDFSSTGAATATEDEENIFMLGSYLFANEVLPTIAGDLMVKDGNITESANDYIDIRAIAAKRSVAQNSFAAITGLKAQGDGESAPFLKALLKEAGIRNPDIEARLGEKPSYFAQMEIMTKDLYQNPEFYANLYDKPVNIERKIAAMQAIEIMQDRDIYDSLIRSEAVLATLIEVLLQDEHRRVTNDLNGIKLDTEVMRNVP